VKNIIRTVATILILQTAGSYLSGCTNQPKSNYQDPSKRYNVIIIVADALRQDAPGCYGGKARTPNIDRLAENGILFENARVTSSWTVPSAISMLTGNYCTTYPYRKLHQTAAINIPKKEIMFGELLKQFNYEPAALLENVQTRRHDWYQGYVILPRDAAYDKHITSAKLNQLTEITGGKLHDESLGYKNTFLLLDHLLNIPSEQRFFVVHWMLDPHSPYDPEKKFLDRIDASQFKLSRPEEEYISVPALDGKVTESEMEYCKARYLAEIESVDERVGYILKMLEHKNILDATYVVFTSDHGEMFGEHDYHGHGKFFYEELLRVPLIISGPKLPAGKRREVNVSLIGLIPTVQELLGISCEHNMQGKSFKKVLFGKGGDKGPLYFDNIQTVKQIDALIEDDFKLIRLVNKDWLLFDLTRDPGEQVNLTSRDYKRVLSMKEKLIALREINNQRRKINKALYGTKSEELSETEREELLKELKTLGYIQ
jgi:arylsulfatase A-like enzyme